MNVKLGESGILFSDAFDFNWIINHYVEDVFPKYNFANENDLVMIKKFIRIVKDRNTTHRYKKLYDEDRYYSTLTIKDKDIKIIEYKFLFIFDKTLNIDHVRIWTETPLTFYMRYILMTNIVRNKPVTQFD